MSKSVIVNQQAKIIEGRLEGFTGNVVGFSYANNEVELELECDFGTTVFVKSEMIEQ